MHLKKWTQAYDNLKSSNLPADNFKKTQWVDTGARNTVGWYWSEDALFWQLLIDHNMDVQYQVNWQLSN